MGGYAADGKYYGAGELGPGEMEWYPPATDEAMPPLDVDAVELDDDRTRFTEPYSGIVGGVDYGGSQRPGSDPYQQSQGRLAPIKVACPPPPEGCGAEVDNRCVFEFDRTIGPRHSRKRETVTGERHMACVARQNKADRS